MKKKSLWSLKLNTATLILIPAAVGINYLGKLLASALRLPLWLDSIGTILSACLAGPVAGVLCGAINNILYGFQDPISFVYAITSVGIGIAAGLLSRLGFFDRVEKVILSALIIGLVAVAISTPLNIIFWGGQTGNFWGDAIFEMNLAGGAPLWFASFLDELVVDVPDKIVTVLVAYGIFKALPKRLTTMLDASAEVEFIDD